MVPSPPPPTVLLSPPAPPPVVRLSPPPPVVRASPPPPSGSNGGLTPTGTLFRGQGTSYAAPAGSLVFSCAYPWNGMSPWQKVYFAAINIQMWDGGLQCGKCARARCVDPRCKIRGQWVAVHFLDQCPTCKRGDIDFSDPAFLELTGLPPDRVAIEWSFTSCKPLVQGGIKLEPKNKDGNMYWQALFLYNSAEPINRVSINGKALKLDTWGFWVHQGLFKKGVGHTLSIGSDQGNMRTMQLTDIWRSQELPIQF